MRLLWGELTEKIHGDFVQVILNNIAVFLFNYILDQF